MVSTSSGNPINYSVIWNDGQTFNELVTDETIRNIEFNRSAFGAPGIYEAQIIVFNGLSYENATIEVTVQRPIETQDFYASGSEIHFVDIDSDWQFNIHFNGSDWPTDVSRSCDFGDNSNLDNSTLVESDNSTVHHYFTQFGDLEATCVIFNQVSSHELKLNVTVVATSYLEGFKLDIQDGISRQNGDFVIEANEEIALTFDIEVGVVQTIELQVNVSSQTININ